MRANDSHRIQDGEKLMAYDIPILRSPHMTLHDVEERDVVEILAACTPAGAGSIGDDAAMLRERSDLARSEAWEFMTLLANSVSGERARSYFVWTVRNRRGDKPVGFVAFSEWSPGDGGIDYACDATEHATAGALRAVMKWAFAARPELRTIRCECPVDDMHRAAVLAAAGFTYRRMHMTLHVECRAVPRPVAEWVTERSAHDRGS